MEPELKIGDIVEAEITKISNFGAFAKFNEKSLGLIHISQISNNFVKDINEHLKLGDKVKARVTKIGPGKKIDLSLKTSPGPQKRKADTGKKSSGFKSSDFEEKLQRFLQDSQTSLVEVKEKKPHK